MRLVQGLTQKVQVLQEGMNGMHVANALLGMRSMRDSQEVRTSIAVVLVYNL